MKHILSRKAVQAALFGASVVVVGVAVVLVVAARSREWETSPLPESEREVGASDTAPTEGVQDETDGADAERPAGEVRDTAAERGSDGDVSTESPAAEEHPPPTPLRDRAAEPPPPPPTPPGPQAPKRITSDSGPPAAAAAMAGVELTEELFVEISAEMVLANEAFTDSASGRASLEEAIGDILASHRVDEAAFQRYSQELLADPEGWERIQDRILQRADALRIADVSMEARDAPRARPPSKARDG